MKMLNELEQWAMDIASQKAYYEYNNNTEIIKHAQVVLELIAGVRELQEFVIAERCLDNSCCFGPPGGMATNGGCRCLDRQNPMELRVKARKMAHAIVTLTRKFKKQL